MKKVIEYQTELPKQRSAFVCFAQLFVSPIDAYCKGGSKNLPKKSRPSPLPFLPFPSLP